MSQLSGRDRIKGSIDLPDFRLVLFKHLDRMGMLFAEAPTNGQHEKFLNISRLSAVEFLEALMDPYQDSVYKDDVKTIVDDKSTNEDDYRYARRKFTAIIKLLGRKRFLPEESESEVLEGWDIEAESKVNKVAS